MNVTQEAYRVFNKLPDRLVVVTVLGALAFVQVGLVSEYTQQAGATASHFTNAYTLISSLLVVYTVLPVFWFGISNRRTTLGQSALVQTAAIVVGLLFLSYYTGAVSITFAVTLSFALVIGFALSIHTVKFAEEQ